MSKCMRASEFISLFKPSLSDCLLKALHMTCSELSQLMMTHESSYDDANNQKIHQEGINGLSVGS